VKKRSVKRDVKKDVKKSVVRRGSALELPRFGGHLNARREVSNGSKE
jgi:hypothetical protein